VLDEAEDRDEIVERIAALEIAKAEVLQEMVGYSTMTRSLLAMSDRLRGLWVTRVVMEATSDYWKPVFYLLEAARFETWLVNAKDVKHLPGRPKSDKIDAVWQCKIAERQMIGPSFVPPPQIRRLRDLTRYRVDLVNACTAEKNRAEKLLEDAQIKLSVVASDIFGVSGRDMMRALIAGERDPKTLAQLARRRMRSKNPVLEEAFVGHFTDHHAFLLAKMLARVEAIETDIAEVEARIEDQVAPFAAAVERLDEIPGVGPAAAHTIIAEIGLHISRFPTAGHLCSWARFAPIINESAGKTKGKNATGQGNPYLARVLGEVAVAAGKTDTFFGERYRRPAHQPRRALPRPRPALLRHPHRSRTQKSSTTSASSKPSAIGSPSNPPPDHHRPHTLDRDHRPGPLPPATWLSIFGLDSWPGGGIARPRSTARGSS
jgi:transposase